MEVQVGNTRHAGMEDRGEMRMLEAKWVVEICQMMCMEAHPFLHF